MATSIERQGQALITAFGSITITEKLRVEWLALLKSYKGTQPFDLNTPSVVEHLTQLREEEYMFNQQATLSTPKKPHYTAKQVAEYWRGMGINPLSKEMLSSIVKEVTKEVIKSMAKLADPQKPKARTVRLDHEALARQLASTHEVRHLTPPVDDSPITLPTCSKCSDTKNASNLSPSGEMRKGHWFHRNANQWQPCGRCAGSGHISEESVERYGRYLTRIQRKKVMNVTFNDFTQAPMSPVH